MIYQSATSITDYKFCSTLFYLRHVLRLRPIEEPESLRMGTNWHKCLEILTLESDIPCSMCNGYEYCPVCDGARIVPNDLREALIRYMNQAYEKCPPSVELVDWEVERTVLLYSALGWKWYYQDDQIETIAREVSFSRQINNLYSRRGKIDRIIRHNGQLCLGEYKSTGKPIDPGSLYWDRLKLDSQLTLYLIEARHAQLAGQLEQFGISATDPLISGMLYDVWHKPGIRPKKLTQAESKKFMADGEYFGEKFEILTEYEPNENRGMGCVTVDGTIAEITSGKKEGTFAIRETPEMFGARLLADIRENPEKHFARKPIARTDKELARFEKEFSNIARLVHFTTRQGLWVRNENHCDATFRCSFHPICYYDLDVENGNVPDGFRRKN